jgi:hypothetical protein
MYIVYCILPKLDEQNQVIGDRYFGSTSLENIIDRFNQHKSAYKRYLHTQKNNCRSFYLFEKYGNEGLMIIQLERYENKQECYEREAYYIKNSLCTNHNIPCQTNMQWRLNNIDNYKRYQLVYQEGYRAKQRNIKEIKKRRANLIEELKSLNIIIQE